jgi:hypothetical protein
MESLIPFSSLLNIQAGPPGGRAPHRSSPIDAFKFNFAQHYMPGEIECQTQAAAAPELQNRARKIPCA